MGNTMTDTLSVIDKQSQPQGNAILDTVQQFAGAVGTSITSAIVTFSQQASHSKADLPTTIGTRNAYWVLVAAAVLLVLIMVRYASKKKHNL
ncbi:permease [Limosilactobacillus sp. STM2_1]|uniref:Permease n=1 Tax=Limosilactobacillus rudii TaxID=2759755 RepID=A0A7W3YMT0_9LACO|nr:permease [Limosilactobacillus rudii]MBB1078472.1 permease [Limosilactobacillus rudii]MBB1096602.1 permease [Limosilactobacillus rudii]MCD7134202.1 permease [Limosilactobacillus rudii]